MITAIITDYERAILDRLREDARLRGLVNALSLLPETAEAAEHTREVYDNAWRKRNGFSTIAAAEAAAELARHERFQEEYRLLYKAGGYEAPYEYGKGRVKVLMRTIEGGKADTVCFPVSFETGGRGRAGGAGSCTGCGRHGAGEKSK